MISDTAPFSCEAAAPESLVAEAHARRLSRRQLQRTLRDVLGRLLGQSKADALVNGAVGASSLPADPDRYQRWNNDFSSAHGQSLFEIADALGKGVAASANAAAFVTAALRLRPGACATVNASQLSVECQKQLVRNLGLRFLRRPLSEASGNDEIAALRAEYDGADQVTALGNLVFRLVLHPASLFQLEVNEAPYPGRPELLKLSSHAIASRLSYGFWNAPPDEGLLALAESTDLQSNEGYAAAIDYVRTKQGGLRDSTREFIGDWLRLESTPAFQSKNPAAFALYAGNVRYDDALRTEMVEEIRELADYVSVHGTFKDLFTTEVSFARGAELMKLYGVDRPAPTDPTPAQAVPIPGGRHPGLLTRAALLVTAAGNKNPVLRGVRIRRDVLCLTTPPPPGNLPADALATPAFNVDLTARDRYALKTSNAPCNSCHAFLNPAGFALSNYNGLGRFETTEPAFQQDGSYANKQLPIDATVDLSTVVLNGGQVSSPSQLGSLIGERPEARKCFAQEYARYFLAREVTAADGCRLNAMYSVLRDGKPLREALQSLALDPQFRLRRL